MRMGITMVERNPGVPMAGGPERSEGERSEPERSGGAPAMGAAAPAPAPVNGGAANPEVVAKPARRRYTAEYKLRILREADACVEPGQIGALLRREGLYSSLLTTWRRQREQGSLTALAPKKQGRKPEKPDPLVRRNAELERENRRLQDRLKQAEMIIDFQKKVSEILGIPRKDPGSEGTA